MDGPKKIPSHNLWVKTLVSPPRKSPVNGKSSPRKWNSNGMSPPPEFSHLLFLHGNELTIDVLFRVHHHPRVDSGAPLIAGSNPMPWEKISSRKMKTDENSWHMDVHFPPYWHMDPYVDPSYVFFKLYGEEKSAFQVLGLVWWFEAPLRWPITRGRTRCDAHTNDWWHPQTPHQRRSWRSCFTTEQRPADLQAP